MTTFTSVATAAFVLLVSSILALWHPLQLTGAMVVGIGLILIVAVAIANDLHRIEKKLSEPTSSRSPLHCPKRASMVRTFIGLKEGRRN
jgi:hypothetical protein